MKELLELYFKNSTEWREWLDTNHAISDGVYLIFYRVASEHESMRWEEAVQVALCFGWIDSTVKKIDEDKRRQKFSPRKPKSVWSKLNKSYLIQLEKNNLIHESGYASIQRAKENGSWESLVAVEAHLIPFDLEKAFAENPTAFNNYQAFAPSYRKSYLYWLNQAKREATRIARIQEIIALCEQNIKSR
ncbi:YdeI/OmpD-associated family protein [Flavobacterium faecale]|uniref:YdeI/OmpD-associated family protein n=1 Tax=Flavobacterium faecale TaxID=1355330 RepID=UPI003AAC3AB5